MQFVVHRPSRGENLIAVVSCDTRWPSVSHIKQAIQRAVTQWVTHTPDGQKAYEAAAGKLDISDLAIFVNNSRLVSCLRDQDIRGLRIALFGIAVDAFVWNFDDSLVDRCELPVEPNVPVLPAGCSLGTDY